MHLGLPVNLTALVRLYEACVSEILKWFMHEIGEWGVSEYKAEPLIFVSLIEKSIVIYGASECKAQSWASKC